MEPSNSFDILFGFEMFDFLPSKQNASCSARIYSC